jgi:hypothetical protein
MRLLKCPVYIDEKLVDKPVLIEAGKATIGQKYRLPPQPEPFTGYEKYKDKDLLVANIERGRGNKDQLVYHLRTLD